MTDEESLSGTGRYGSYTGHNMMRWILLLMWHALAALASWLFGLFMYAAWLAIAYGEVVTWGGDLKSVLMWSFITYVLLVPWVYLPCLFALRWWRNGGHPVILFPLLGGALGVLPTAALMFFWGGRVRDLLSSETMLFFVLFASAGAAFGLAYAWRHNRFEQREPRGFAPVLDRS